MRSHTRKLCLIFLLSTAVLMACTENETAKNGVSSNGETKNEKAEAIDYSSLRNINNFSAGTGNAYADTLHVHMLVSSPMEQHANLCVGDFCAAYQHLRPPQSDSSFYFFKGDSGEYGFSNYQYLLWKDSIVYARTFEVSPVYTKAGDRYRWSITESEFRFSPNAAIQLLRTDSAQDLDNHPFDFNTAPNLLKANADSAYAASKKQLDELLRMKEDTATN